MNPQEWDTARRSTSPSRQEKNASSGVRGTLHVLLAEDNPGDVLLIREALELEQLDFVLVVQRDGEAMLTFIDRLDAGEVPCPDIVLLDLNLPKHSGKELLERMRKSSACSDAPVVVITSSDFSKDREAAQRLGASAYFRKPTDYDEFMRLGGVVRKLLAQRSASDGPTKPHSGTENP